ncbi:MAG: hypothetical protein A3G75_08725 [Verrucomicrobia bacterium RIFCSPLOWO2_12_FULL_64_8]|nr:MAG: hypothetical protein A3G75_08725 [Verrucomicrobia bacterium RIFCSPLOWO2_12_FULL_64_8]
MKRMLLVLLLGAATAVGSHLAWFQLRRPCAGDSLDCQLEWMKTELKLSDEQFVRLKAIHETSNPRLLALAGQVARLREEYAAFERERTTSGEVDFLEFARFVEQRRSIDRECLASTQQLVAAAAGVMTPEQREHYFGLLNPALRAENSRTYFN